MGQTDNSDQILDDLFEDEIKSADEHSKQPRTVDQKLPLQNRLHGTYGKISPQLVTDSTPGAKTAITTQQWRYRDGHFDTETTHETNCTTCLPTTAPNAGQDAHRNPRQARVQSPIKHSTRQCTNLQSLNKTEMETAAVLRTPHQFPNSWSPLQLPDISATPRLIFKSRTALVSEIPAVSESTGPWSQTMNKRMGVNSDVAPGDKTLAQGDSAHLSELMYRPGTPSEQELKQIGFELDGVIEQVGSVQLRHQLHAIDPNLPKQLLFRICRDAILASDFEGAGVVSFVNQKVPLGISSGDSELAHNSIMHSKPYLHEVSPVEVQGHHPSMITKASQLRQSRTSSLMGESMMSDAESDTQDDELESTKSHVDIKDIEQENRVFVSRQRSVLRSPSQSTTETLQLSAQDNRSPLRRSVASVAAIPQAVKGSIVTGVGVLRSRNMHDAQNGSNFPVEDADMSLSSPLSPTLTGITDQIRQPRLRPGQNGQDVAVDIMLDSKIGGRPTNLRSVSKARPRKPNIIVKSTDKDTKIEITHPGVQGDNVKVKKPRSASRKASSKTTIHGGYKKGVEHVPRVPSLPLDMDLDLPLPELGFGCGGVHRPPGPVCGRPFNPDEDTEEAENRRKSLAPHETGAKGRFQRGSGVIVRPCPICGRPSNLDEPQKRPKTKAAKSKHSPAVPNKDTDMSEDDTKGAVSKIKSKSLSKPAKTPPTQCSGHVIPNNISYNTPMSGGRQRAEAEVGLRRSPRFAHLKNDLEV